MTPSTDTADAFTQAVDELIRSRRTISAFLPDAPPKELVLAALDVAVWAPNHHKTEPWRFHWLGPETARSIVALNARLVAEKKGPDAAETKRRQWSAVPGWLLATCLRAADPLQQEEDYAACCCAVQNLLLALWSRGVGAKWTTGDVTRHHEFFQRVALDPAAHRVVGLIWYGYPATTPAQQRRPAREFLRELP